ncbi:LytTR family DNA-binding domain-containing protein [Fibrella forsythiae]|uniref:LytTR family transcriptional regulator n=1 Tax=Fibrella forsythiae TaxID=2817061 RepID=A0ABS3JQX1_9BACT|nr:LytTR family DNA-binding domain-containing protein [Fibrella forsythiae]MBO0951332.1 LytTR family transcriptional regulator [Fibrella forsythiae]
MTDVPSIPLNFRTRLQWKPFLLLTLVGILLYQLMTLQRTEGSDFEPLRQGNVWHYLKMLFGYYYLFELVSVLIFVRLTLWYVDVLKLHNLEPSLGAVVRYELLFLPLFLVSILVFGPITNTLRYLVLFYPNYEWTAYFPEYFFTGRMYANYLLPFLIVGYGFVNINLFLDYNAYQQQQLNRLRNQSPTGTLTGLVTPAYPTHIDASDAEGETRIPVAGIWYVEVENKSYMAYTTGRTYQLRKTLSELEAELNPAQFFRINRSVLLNLAYLKNFSFWENDKYILRLTDNKTEFVIQRTRLKELKERIGSEPAH